MSTTATALRSWTRIRIWSGHCRDTSTEATGSSASIRSVIAARSTPGQGLAGGYGGRGDDLLVAEHPGALDVDALDRERGGEEEQPDGADHQGQHGAEHDHPAPGQPASGPLAAGEPLARGLGDVVTLLGAGVGHAGASSSSRTRGPSVVMVPAPRVSTMSPGRASETSSAGDGVEVGLEVHPLRRQRHRVGDEPSGDGGVGVLAGEVDVQHHDLVGGAELLAHPGAEDPGAGDQVRLEGDDQATVAGHRAGGLEVAADLAGVVGVAVVDPHSPGLALALHAPAGAGEGGQAGGRPSKRVPELEPDGDRGQRVEDVVASGDLQGHLAERLAPSSTVNVVVLPSWRRSVARRSAPSETPYVVTPRPRSRASVAGEAVARRRRPR